MNSDRISSNTICTSVNLHLIRSINYENLLTLKAHHYAPYYQYCAISGALVSLAAPRTGRDTRQHVLYTAE